MMKKIQQPPEIAVAMTIAGSDSGGGAGIQTDLRTFRSLGVFGTSAITAITAQNPMEVIRIDPVPPEGVAAQMCAVLKALKVRAAKTGMLFSAEIIHTVCDILEREFHGPLVVDPVMVSTSGVRLLRDDAIDAVKSRLLPIASWITPNIPEAELILDGKIASREDAFAAAKELSARFHTGVILKGGHAESDREACDVIAEDSGRQIYMLSCPRLVLPPHAAHGTGCTLSAALAASLAQGYPAPDAIRRAKAFVFGSLQNVRMISNEKQMIAGMYPPDDLTSFMQQITVKE